MTARGWCFFRRATAPPALLPEVNSRNIGRSGREAFRVDSGAGLPGFDKRCGSGCKRACSSRPRSSYAKLLCGHRKACCGHWATQAVENFEAFIHKYRRRRLLSREPNTLQRMRVSSSSGPPCHGHYHLSGFTSYEVYSNSAGNRDGSHGPANRPSALKISRALIAGARPAGGLTAPIRESMVGCGAVYGSYLGLPKDRQSQDIPTGQLRLRITVNAEPGLSFAVDGVGTIPPNNTARSAGGRSPRQRGRGQNRRNTRFSHGGKRPFRLPWRAECHLNWRAAQTSNGRPMDAQTKSRGGVLLGLRLRPSLRGKGAR
jgi:hypothetical protein